MNKEKMISIISAVVTVVGVGAFGWHRTGSATKR